MNTSVVDADYDAGIVNDDGFVSVGRSVVEITYVDTFEQEHTALFVRADPLDCIRMESFLSTLPDDFVVTKERIITIQ